METLQTVESGLLFDGSHSFNHTQYEQKRIRFLRRSKNRMSQTITTNSYRRLPHRGSAFGSFCRATYVWPTCGEPYSSWPADCVSCSSYADHSVHRLYIVFFTLYAVHRIVHRILHIVFRLRRTILRLSYSALIFSLACLSRSA